MVFSRGILSEYNPAKRITKLKKYINRAKNFDLDTSFKDLSKFMKSFKRYTEKEIGKKISANDLYNEVHKKLNESNINIEPSILKSCIFKLLDVKKGKHKSILSNGISTGTTGAKKDQEYEVNAYIALGCVLIACSTLVALIGFAAPPAAPFCYGVSENMAVLGAGLIATGICENDKNKKSIISSL